MRNLFANIVTTKVTAANNRGESIDNISTLQRINFGEAVHTALTGNSIRFALRHVIQRLSEKESNREFNNQTGEIRFKNPSHNASKFIDDDSFGYFRTEPKKDKKNGEVDSGTCDKRRGPLSVGPAISLTPSLPLQNKSFGVRFKETKQDKPEENDQMIFHSELHGTWYQYPIGLNMDGFQNKENAYEVIRALKDLSEIGGNHARFLNDYGPESIILRTTNGLSSKVMNCFEYVQGDSGCGYRLTDIFLHKVQSGDIPASELHVGGVISMESRSDAKILAKAGVVLHGSVGAAIDSAIAALKK